MSQKMRAYCFTHNNFKYAAKDLPVYDQERYLVWQHEKVDTDHIQGYIELKTPQRVSALIKWLPGAHFEARKGTPEQARDYCMEEDTRVEGPWERGVFGGRQGRRSDVCDVKDAIKSGMSRRDVFEEYPEVAAKYPRFVESLIKFRNEDQVEKIMDYVPKYKWQAEVLGHVQVEAHSRRIYWIYDSIGNHGKTYLAKHLVDKYGAYYTNGGKASDLTYAYSGEPVVVFDYVRESKEYVGYGVIEQLKNGILMSVKYESGTKRFKVPHVFVFANFLPEEGKFSEDRLRITTIYGIPEERI